MIKMEEVRVENDWPAVRDNSLSSSVEWGGLVWCGVVWGGISYHES